MDITKYQADVQNLILEIQKFRGVDPERILAACDELEEHGARENDQGLIGFAKFSRGETYYLLNDVMRFYNEMTGCVSLMEAIGEWGYVVMANNMLGIMSLNRGNAPYAMDYYLRALSICKKYEITNLEWIVNMNMGALYLNIEEYSKALEHIESAYNYIISNTGMDNYIQNLTNVYVGMGKAYLCLDKLDKANEFLERIEFECLQSLDEIDKIMVYSFKARLCHEQRNLGKRDVTIYDMNKIIDSHIPIMDFFDDIYEYLSLLLGIEYYDDFFLVLDVVERLTKVTAIKNLERKLLSLKIKYYRENNKRGEYMRAAVLYYELTEYMEKENHNMISNMINLRNSFNDLTAITKEFKEENRALQKKSETDAMTRMANRFGLERHFHKAFENAIKNSTSFAIEILDIDYFKQYNDNYGHQAGDRCIKAVADAITMQQEYGKVFCARYGGDEFIIIYEGFKYSRIEKMATTLKMRIESKRIRHEYSKASNIVTISQGICYGIPKEGEKVEDYLHRADDLLYKAKEVSRNTIAIGKYEEK